MKKCLSLLLVIALALCLVACSPRQPEYEAPVRFYYPRTQVTYGETDSVLTWELREGAPHMNDPARLLEEYLKGPVTEGLTSLFPAETRLVSLEIIEGVALVVLNEEAALSGMELTLACSGFTMTCLELTGAERVQITIGENQPILMDRDNIILSDSGMAETQPAE